MGEFFRKFARRISDLLGRAEAFLLALVLIMIWAALSVRPTTIRTRGSSW